MQNEQLPELTQATRTLANYIAMVIRNAMENFHHEHLSDKQMKCLNPPQRRLHSTSCFRKLRGFASIHSIR